MSGELNHLTDDEMSILSTGLVALIDSRLCSRDKKGRFVIRCTDGRKRVLSEAGFVDVADKLSILAGHGSVKDDAVELAHIGGVR